MAAEETNGHFQKELAALSSQTARTPSFVIGTAGHVDHGKTELVKALTGINTDRLAEEQARSMSIDLGFAHLDLPDGTRIGIVDVPGHERFIKNMLAGATGIDLVMLVVAADEGVKPQTIEHLDIITLLGIQSGLVVMTKIDLVDDELAELGEEDIRAALVGSPLDGAPVVRVSAKTGQGLRELVTALTEQVGQVRPADVRGPARLPVDRVFTMPGFGLVATGTLIRGRLSRGDEVEILPAGHVAYVRGIETHGVDVSEVSAARRVAVNLSRLSGERIERGDTICAKGSMTPSGLLDVRLSLLHRTREPLKQRTRVRVHHGTAERLGRVYFMDRDALSPGESCFAQLRLERPVVAARGDRCVIRSYSPMTTIGGGVVIDPNPRPHRRDRSVIADLETMEAGAHRDLALRWLAHRKEALFVPRDLARALQLDATDAEQLITELLQEGAVVRLANSSAFVSAQVHRAVTERVVWALREYHRANPLRETMPKDALQAAVKRPAPALVDDVLARLAAEGRITCGPQGVRMADHVVELSPEHERAMDAMRSLARHAHFAPPTRDAVLAAARLPHEEARALLAWLLRSGDLVAVGDHIYHRETIEETKRLAARRFKEKGPFTIADLRDLTGPSRKYVVPLAEYLDGIGFTRRQGNVRIIVRQEETTNRSGNGCAT